MRRVLESGFVCTSLSKSHAYELTEPVDWSMNVTVRGAVPARGVVFVKAATGATGAAVTAT